MSDAPRGRGRGGVRGDGSQRGGGRGGRGGSAERGRGQSSDRGGGGGGFRGERGGGSRGDGGGRGGNFRGADRGGGRGRGGGGRGGGAPMPPRVDAAIYKGNEAAPTPDAAITKFENDKIADPSTKLGALSITEALPIRDAYGTAGRPVVMRTNYFLTRLQGNPTVFRYNLTFEKDDGLSRARKRRYIELLLQQAPFSKVVHYSDMSANLFTLEKLNLPQKDRGEYRIIIHDRLEAKFPEPKADDADGIKAARTRKTRKLRVEYTTSYVLNDLYRYVQSNSGNSYAAKGDVVQAMNIIFNHAAASHQRITAQPNNKFYPLTDFGAVGNPNHPNAEQWALGEGLVAIRGYYSSVRLGPSRVMVNVNVATGAFYEAIPLHTLIANFMGNRGFNNEYNVKLCTSFIKGLKVLTRYSGEKKVRTVRGLTKQPLAQNATQATFNETNAQGQSRRVTVANYFRTKYNYTVTQPNLPVINCGTEKDMMLIPAECCVVIAGQPARRLLSANQTKVMIGFAGRPPNANASSIETSGLQMMQLTNDAQKNTIGKAGIQMQTNMLTVPARILPAPVIKFQKTLTPKDGSWNLANQKFCKPSRLHGIFSSLQINVADRRIVVQDFAAAARTIHGEFNKYGVSTEQYRDPTPAMTLQNLDKQYFGQIMKNLDAKFAGAAQNKITYILISIPEKNNVLYAIIKYLGDVKYGINTVLVQDSNVGKVMGINNPRGPDPMLSANLALKFSMKSGGQPWAVSPTDLPLIKKKTMVIGLDVTHPSPTSKDSAPSIAAIAWSKDPALSAWFADGMTQTGRREMIDGLPVLLGDAIASWRKHNGNQLPDEILVFRDGVSEGQFHQVLDVEFGLMKNVFDKVYGPGKHPKVSIIVCGKRHHTRFYPTRLQDSDAAGGRGSHNPAPGLVVDRHITGYGENAFDLYLQPHKALQGTAKPCHYIVIKNETGMRAAELERTIHAMCYGFTRATKAVSLCPPAYCADKAAERFRAYLYQDMNDDDSSAASFTSSGAAWTRGVHPNLRETMFYL